jgi:hypothetical protein
VPFKKQKVPLPKPGEQSGTFGIRGRSIEQEVLMQLLAQQFASPEEELLQILSQLGTSQNASA